MTTSNGPSIVSSGMSETWRRRLPLLPALIFVIVLTQLPFIGTLIVSFMDWNAYYPDERGFADAAIRLLTDAAAAARPIDDVRGSAAYRRLALGVLARRAVGWAMEQRAEEALAIGLVDEVVPEAELLDRTR